VQMAHHLDIKVIASDIESDTHLEVAKTVGCDAGQGDWQCPSLDFDKLCSALFSKHQAAREARNAIEAAAPERELSRATG
jgi:EAL domain-containing protein (putative c-di-GMP-specific phosphodiesterase class I)